MSDMTYILGTGVLTWDGSERRSDRYGSVFLMQEGSTSMTSEPVIPQIDPIGLSDIVGMYGTLKAIVVTTRQSTHIGDLFRGVSPSTPDVGDVIILGTGVAFIADNRHGYDAVGVLPSDGRASDWLDIEALYRAHEQTVTLVFEVTK